MDTEVTYTLTESDAELIRHVLFNTAMCIENHFFRADCLDEIEGIYLLLKECKDTSNR